MRNLPLAILSITAFANSGVSEHFLDSHLILGLQNGMGKYLILETTHNILVGGQRALEGIAPGTSHGSVGNVRGITKTMMAFPAVVVSVLRGTCSPLPRRLTWAW